MKVDFAIIGAMKSGTTSIAHFLSIHPEVCFCITKEPAFFSKYPDWRNRLDNYHSLFIPKKAQIIGEASTMYTMQHDYPDVSQRMFEYNPDFKLIYIMRDPVKRIVSHYAHRHVRKRTKGEPEEEIKNNMSYLDRSRYFHQISYYLQRFPRENILLLLFEDFVADPKKVLKELAVFLEIEASFYDNLNEFQAKNTSESRKIFPDRNNAFLNYLKRIGQTYLPLNYKNWLLSFLGNELQVKPKFSLDLQIEIHKLLEPDILEVEKIIQRNLDFWRNPYLTKRK